MAALEGAAAAEAPIEEGDHLGPFLGAGIRALTDEIHEARRRDSAEFDLFDGRLLEVSNGRALMRFRTEMYVHLAAESPVTVRSATDVEKFAGTVVGVEEFAVVVEVELGLPDVVPVAKMQVDAAFVLVAVRDRLEAALAEVETCGPLPRALCSLEDPPGVTSAGVPYVATTDQLNQLQHAAIDECLASSLQFVWGPPGTGKTRALGHLVASLVAAGERVLVLAHANVAVDTALLSALSALPTDLVLQGRVLRVGTAQRDEMREQDDVILRSVAARRLPAVAAELDAVDEEQRVVLQGLASGALGASKTKGVVARLRKRRKELIDRLREVEGELIADAAVVATTSAKSCLDKRIYASRFDSVVVDEASMMGLAPSLVAALIASCRIVFFGDFRQLPPIVLAESDVARRMLERDAFAASGARSEIEAGRDTPLISMLDLQYRMTRPVASVVNDLAYGGRLKTYRRDLGDREGLWRGSSLVLVDTSALASSVVRETSVDGRSASRANPLHGLLTASIASSLAAAGPSVAVMSPYRAQARLLATLCSEVSDAEYPVVATIHRFQGAEADRVVIDLVDASPMTTVSPLTGGDPEMTLRLMNVALSRARDRVFVVADCQFFQEALPRSSPVRHVLDAMAERGEIVEATELVGSALSSLIVSPSFVDVAAEWICSSGGHLLLNMPQADDKVADRMAAATMKARASVTVHAPLAIAEHFESGPADLQLVTCPGGAFVLGDDAVIFAPLGITGPAWSLRGARAAAAFRHLLVPDPVGDA